MNIRRISLSLILIVLVTLIAFGTRMYAVNHIPIDFDEDDYLGAAQHYAHAILQNNWQEVINYNYNYEHPPLTKLVYAFSILREPEAPQLPERPSTDPPAKSLPEPQFTTARTTSAVLGTLEVLTLAIVSPLAAFFLAIFTWQIKYTSQIMLEPLPAFTSMLMVLFYTLSKKQGKPQGKSPWLWASAVMFGITVASKYTYGIAAVAVLLDWMIETRPELPRGADRLRVQARWLAPFAAWGLAAVVVFFLFNPHLWADPFNRLKASILFHGGYAESQHVKDAGYPAWQPFVWLAQSVPWSPGAFFISIDLYISLLALAGWKRSWDKYRVYALWLVLALSFLLVWPTKWPQYLLILTAPLCLAGAEGFKALVGEPLARAARNWMDRLAKKPEAVKPAAAPVRMQTRKAIPWLLPGILALSLITLFPMIYQVSMALTDFNRLSIKDGIQGGVLREAWLGITGQEPWRKINLGNDSYGRLTIQILNRDASKPWNNQEVHFIGPSLIMATINGASGGLLVQTLLWTVLSVAFQTALGLILAMMLSRPGIRLAKFWSAVFILPWAIPEFIGAMIWWFALDASHGWVSLFVKHELTWPQSPESTLGVFLLAATWLGFPFMMVAAMAGLKLLPTEVYDAAAVDGANGWRRFWLVTWPLLLPLLAPAMVIRAIFAFNQFYLFYVLGGPYFVANYATLSYVIFNPATGGNYAFSAAINIFSLLALVVFIVMLNRWSRASEGVTYA